MFAAFFFLLFFQLFVVANGRLQLTLYQNGAPNGKYSERRGDKLIWADFLNEYLLTNMTLGSPPKEFWLSVESGSKYLWVIDSQNPQKLPNQQTYDAKLSSTSKFIRDDFKTTSGQMDLTGSAYEDNASFGFDFRQSFGSITKIDTSDVGSDTLLDGSIGLAWGPFGEDPNNDHLAPIVSLLSVYPLPLQFYTLWIGSHVSPLKAASATGLITLGDFDELHCKTEQPLYVPLSIDEVYNYMYFQISNFKFSGQNIPLTNTNAYLDTGSPVIQVSTRVSVLINSVLNPEYDWNKKVYTLDCGAKDQLPAWTFTINGMDFSIEAKNYLIDLALSENKCALAFTLAEDAQMFVLGLPMLRSYCTIYELIGQRVGFLGVN
ncbi:Eukaryotic aspartyl protease [Aphelenchoides bicaudatus]|nr:Eukaryotic aspartyl protease [Aphelenchoides bicaudatus]